MNILALDLSLTSTGWAAGPNIYGTIRTDTTGPARLSHIRDRILELHHNHHIDLIAIEGYSYGSRSSQAHSLGELGGVIRCSLHDANIDHLDVSPSTVKKYATGKGNASKSNVLVNAVKRLGYDGDSTDEADALWIHATVADATGTPWVDVPQTHRDALAPIVAALHATEDAA